jgi:PKD repeat protein
MAPAIILRLVVGGLVGTLLLGCLSITTPAEPSESLAIPIASATAEATLVPQTAGPTAAPTADITFPPPSADITIPPPTLEPPPTEPLSPSPSAPPSPTDTPTDTPTPTAPPTATPTPTPKPVAQFTWSQSGSLTIKFKNTSIAPGATWSWDFGDFAPLSTKKNPTQSFNDPGVYPVTLTATNGGGRDRFTASVVVEPSTPTSPNADFTWEPAGVLEVQFTDRSSSDVQEWRWDFGDGSDPLGPCNCPNPTHVFPAGNQDYTVTLLVSNGENSDDVTYFVFVTND